MRRPRHNVRSTIAGKHRKPNWQREYWHGNWSPRRDSANDGRRRHLDAAIHPDSPSAPSSLYGGRQYTDGGQRFSMQGIILRTETGGEMGTQVCPDDSRMQRLSRGGYSRALLHPSLFREDTFSQFMRHERRGSQVGRHAIAVANVVGRALDHRQGRRAGDFSDRDIIESRRAIGAGSVPQRLTLDEPRATSRSGMDGK